MKKILYSLAAFASVLFFCVGLNYVLVHNKQLGVTEYGFTSDKLTKELTIAHISDLHNTELDDGNASIISALESAKPDLIAITGDLIDSRSPDTDIALSLVRAAAELAPVCYVPGNHEARIPAEYAELKKGLAHIGVTVLEDDACTLSLGGQSLTALGLSDPSVSGDIGERLDALCEPSEGFVLLLAHHPEFFDTYSRYPVDLVLSGHAHGGQIRLPLLRGVVAPDQGLFPIYAEGFIGPVNGTRMAVSRGLGNSLLPLRINNDPELVLIHIGAATETPE